MSYFLHLCDCSLLYCASLEAWNWVVAGQHLNVSYPRSSIWPNQNVSIFSGNFVWKTLNFHIASTVRAFDLIPKVRARPEYQLLSGNKSAYVSLYGNMFSYNFSILLVDRFIIIENRETCINIKSSIFYLSEFLDKCFWKKKKKHISLLSTTS